DDNPISLSWIYTKQENRLLESLYRLSHGRNIKEFRSALPLLHAPGLNVMYGDAKGNIAWWATAKLYQMPDSLSTKFVLDGSTGKEEPIRYLDFEENPHAVNPSWDYVYSANNQPDSIAGIAYPGYYLPENRARRIVELLEGQEKWDMNNVGDMINDVVSSVNPEIVSNMANQIDLKKLTDEESGLLDQLIDWKGDNTMGSTEPALFHKWLYFIFKNAFEDELGTERFNQFLNTHLFKRTIAPLSQNSESIWWDNIHTKEITEQQQDIVTASFLQAVDSLKEILGPETHSWTWDRIHTIEHKHPIGEVESLRSFFNVGPFPIHGTREVINNMTFPYDSTGTFKVKSGPSTRRVIDFSDIENGLGILPTGQSGNPLSRHYRDQAEMYNKGEYRKMMLNKEEIIATSKSLLIFRPH
ncbi:MAG: penicillin acylase family protein, partial [Flavobacteriaceae bacterium]